MSTYGTRKMSQAAPDRMNNLDLQVCSTDKASLTRRIKNPMKNLTKTIISAHQDTASQQLDEFSLKNTQNNTISALESGRAPSTGLDTLEKTETQNIHRLTASAAQTPQAGIVPKIIFQSNRGQLQSVLQGQRKEMASKTTQNQVKLNELLSKTLDNVGRPSTMDEVSEPMTQKQKSRQSV